MSFYASESSSPAASDSFPPDGSDFDVDVSSNADLEDNAELDGGADPDQPGNAGTNDYLASGLKSNEAGGPASHRTPVKAVKSRQPKDAAYNQEVVEEMDGRWVEVTTERFLEDFLPEGNLVETSLPPVLARWKETLAALKFSKGSEVEAYLPLCNAFNAVLVDVMNATDPVRFYRTWKYPQSGDDDLKPDLSLYSTREKPYANPTANAREDDARVQWSHIEIPVEVKVDLRYAPFNFSDAPFRIKNTEEGLKSLAQMIKYASEIQLYQHRTCVFLIWIQSDWLRLTRWDRTGAVVSKAFQYTTNPDPLLTFLCRYAVADRVQRGHDPTVTLVAKDDPDRTKLTNLKAINGWENWYLKNELRVDDENYPLRKVTCPLISGENPAHGEDTIREGTYLIRKFRFGSHTPLGRGTKCYVAFDVGHKRLVFIKDYWFADAPTIASETTTHILLRAKHVKNIATVIAGGDVGGTRAQRSRNQDYMTTLDESRKPKPRYHDRLVFQEVGRPLETHVDQLELIRTVRDALTAHRDAYVLARVLHRDVCPENILINIYTGTGFLSDWELARSLDYIHNPASQPVRSGTWLTMSARLLRDPFAHNDLSDDLESFVHTIGLMRLRYYFHCLSPGYARGKVDVSLNKNNTTLAHHLSHFYEARCVTTPGEPPQGTGSKELLFQSTRSSVQMPQCPIQSLLAGLYKLFRRYYDVVDTDLLPSFTQLDDHEEVLDIFERHALASDYVLAKSGDQFEDLYEMKGGHQTRGTGGAKRQWLSLPKDMPVTEPTKKKQRTARNTPTDG